MTTNHLSKLSVIAVSFVFLILTAVSAQAGSGPYVVRGNQHMIVGITLNEAAVLAALPKGLVPTKGVTGGINVYSSKGGEGVAAYSRFYVWADVAGHDSVNGTPGRYILWAATSTGPDKLKKAGNVEVQGAAVMKKSDRDVSGVATAGGEELAKIAIKLADGPKCGPLAGSVNYPSKRASDGKMVITQYTAAGTACGAAPVSVAFSVDTSHPLSKYKPTKLTWAAFVPDLSFSGSPLIPIKLAEK